MKIHLTNLRSVKIYFLLILFLMLNVFILQSNAAIEINIDVSGANEKSSTHAKKVFIERVELSFPNNLPSQTVAQFSKGFYAKARFKYLGNGPLTIRWLVDGYVVSQTTEILSFGKEITIKSNKNNVSLPTFVQGTHSIDIQFINSLGIIDVVSKSIKYFVTDGIADFKEEGVLKVLYPKDRSVDPFDFYFRWKGFKGFNAYQLEVESISDKTKSSKSIIKALSKIDVYSPSDSQRIELTSGQYRWRVKGLYKKKGFKPLLSKWASFEVTDQPEKGGVFIAAVNTVKANPLNAAVFDVKKFKLQKIQGITKTQSLLSKGIVLGGDDYRLGVQLQNSSAIARNNLIMEVSGKGGLLGSYPVDLPAKTNSAITVPLKVGAVNLEQFQNISISIIEGIDQIDQATLNLSIEPKVEINGLDFVEQKNTFNRSSALNICGESIHANALFSKMVSVLEIDYAKDNTPSYRVSDLNTSGYFSFRQGQKVRFATFLQDKGLANWLETNCPTGFSGLQNQQLPFIAYPVDDVGNINGASFELGNITLGADFIAGFEDVVLGSEATIPTTGHYKISLNNMSALEDLYVTRKKHLPQFIHASGFVFEVVSLSSNSSLNSTITPNQANLSGVVKATWKNDSNNSELLFNIKDITVSMNKSPVYAELLSGQIELKNSTQLSLFGFDFKLNYLNVNEQTALAQLSYQLPTEYQQAASSSLNDKFTKPIAAANNSLFNLPLNSSKFSKTEGFNSVLQKTKISKVNPIVAKAGFNSLNPVELIQFDNVPVFNGGEFIARYQFSHNRKDVSLLGSRLALRLRHAEFIADLSPKVNYDDYTQQADFIGIGFYDATLRIKVSQQNSLFAVSDENPYLYAKAHWLEIDNAGLSGDDIEVLNDSLIVDFFNQKAAPMLSLVSPFGFELKITGGTFGLANSQVTGIDFKGSVALPKSEVLLAQSNYPLNFEHLVKNGDNFLAIINSDDYQVSLGVFNYQPEELVLHIGQGNIAINNDTEPDNLDQLNQQAVSNWYNQLSFDNNSGLQLTGGVFNTGWSLLSENSIEIPSQGKFLLNATGLTGQWLEYQDSGNALNHFDINGFDTSVSSHWLKFDDSSLTDSHISGRFHIPYPVNVQFSFSGKLNQESGLDIAEDGLYLVTEQTGRLPQAPKLELDYWNAELSLALQTSSKAPIQHILYDAENSRILLDDFFLRLKVDEETLGGEEFVAKGNKPAFKISTYLTPNGQLEDTVAKANIKAFSKSNPNTQSIRFLGQPFSLNSIEFLPYVGNGQAPEGDEELSAIPLVKIIGGVGFSVFGLQYSEINHTALGARVPVISPEFGISDESGDGYYGDKDGMIKVYADLKFSNTFGLNSNTLSTTANALSDQPIIAPQPYKAFVGEAELVLINAFSMKGLAEAGLHLEQGFPNAEGQWQNGSDDVAYERIGLGAGVDVLKAAISGQEAFDNAARLGASGITLVTGAKGIKKEVIELGAEAITVTESVAVAVTLKTPDAILHAVDNGLAAADKGIALLKAICVEGDVPCTPEINGVLELSSIMLRGAGVATEYPNIDPIKVASVALQTMDKSIPLIRGINPDELFQNQTNLTLNDKYQAVLSVAHTQVIAGKSLIDNKGIIPFSDFMLISQSYVDSIEAVADISEINDFLSDSAIKPILDLSIDLAKESIAMAQDIKNNPSPQKLAMLAKDYVGILCQQSKGLMPLLPVELNQQEDLLKSVMGVSSVVLDKLSKTQMPANPQLAMQFLRVVLKALANNETGTAACGGQGIALPAAAKGLLNMAAHSLKPLTGELKTEQDQIVWALEGTKLSIEVMQPIAVAQNLDTSAIIPINKVLDNLIQTFGQLANGLNSDANIANGQKVLRMAAGIPNAFNELIQSSGAYQASELMEVYVIILSELDELLNHANELAQGDTSHVDLLSLPIKLVEQTQSLSFIGQNEKLNLSNVSYILNMSREVTSEQPKLSKVMADMRSIHSNIKVLGGSGDNNPANKREVEQVITLLELLAGLADDHQQLAGLLVETISELIPLFIIDPTLFSADEIDRFIKSIRIAFPVVDYHQSDRKETIDEVLPKLLNQAEDEAETPEEKEKIKQARDILESADREFVGFVVVYKKDNDGNDIEKHLPISAKEVAADDSIREIFFREKRAKHEYDTFNTTYTRAASIMVEGGLKETTTIILPEGFDFTQLEDVNKKSLFTEYWTNIIHSGDFIKRQYVENIDDENDASHEIVIERLDDGQFEATMVLLKTFGRFQYQHKIHFSTMPEGIFYPNNIELNGQIGSDGKIISATFYRPKNSADAAACEYQFGCVYVTKSGSNQLTLLANYEDTSKAVYESANTPIYRSLNQIGFTANSQGIFSSPKLISFEGHIKSDVAGWNDDWLVHYKNNELTLIQGKSSERIHLPNSAASLNELVIHVIQSTQFKHRRVINGEVVWDYNMQTHNALKSDGVGNWWLYKMPDTLSSVLVPEPTGIVDIDANGFILQAKKVNGESDIPPEMQTDDGSFKIPAGDPDDGISIGSNGDILIGDKPINEPKNGKKVKDRKFNPDGGSDTWFDDGSKKTIQYPDQSDDVDPQNLEVTRTESAKIGSDGKPLAQGRRIKSTIKYCKDKTKSFEQCPANKKFEESFEYDETPVFVAANNQCNAITPVSGVNQQLKHQLWVQFFRMEADLYQNPSEQGLKVLRAFANQAVEQGLDLEEVNEQYSCVLHKIGNRLVGQLFDEYEAGADNPQKLDEWDKNPDSSPFKRLSKMMGELFAGNPKVTSGFTDFKARTKEVKTRAIRKRLIDIPDIEDIDNATESLSDAGSDVFDKLGKYIKEVLDLEGFKQLVGDEASGSFSDICQTFNAVVSQLHEKYGLNTGQALPMTEEDIQLILSLEGNKQVLGCSGGNSILSDLISHATNAGLDAASAAALGAENVDDNSLNVAFALLVKKVTKAIKGEAEIGFETEAQLRQAYLEKLMGFEFVSDFKATKSSKTNLMIDHIFKLQRLIQLVNSNANVSTGINTITDADFGTLQSELFDGIKTHWKTQWDTHYAALLSALDSEPSQVVEELNSLGEWYEQAKLLNSKMNVTFLEEEKRTIISIDADLYLKVTVLDDTTNVIDQLLEKQQSIKQLIWNTTLSDEELNIQIDSLRAMEYANKWIHKTAKVGKTGGLNSTDELLIDDIETYFNQVSGNLSSFNINEEPEVDAVFSSGEQKRKMVSIEGMLPNSKSAFFARVNALSQQVTDNITEFNIQIQSYKLVAIDLVYKDQETNLSDEIAANVDVRDQLIDELLKSIEPSKLEGKTSYKIAQTIKKILDLQGDNEDLGGENGSIMADLVPAVDFMAQRELSEAQNNNDIKSLNSVIDAMGQSASLGGETDMLAEVNSIIINLSSALRNSIVSCISNENCTHLHYKRWVELLELESQAGSEQTSGNTLEMFDTMKSSSPATWDDSEQHNYSISSLKQRVKIHVGRQIVAAEFQRLVDSLNVDIESNRVLMRGLVADMEKLESIPLSNGQQYSLNNTNNLDPLLGVLEPLRGLLYTWLAEKQDEIEAYLKQNPEQLTAKGSELSSVFGVSNAEIKTVILPAINNSKPMKTHSGDRYTEAANILKTIPNKKNAAKLSFNLLKTVPNPEYSSQQAMFTASVTTFAKHIADQLVGASSVAALEQPSEQQMLLAMERMMQQYPSAMQSLISSQHGRLMNVSTVNLPLVYASLLEEIIAAQKGEGDLLALSDQFLTLFTNLLLLPSQEAPISALSTLLKQQFIEPLLGTLSCQGGENINPMRCVLGTGINIASLSLDGFIQAQQNNDSTDSLSIVKSMANNLSELSISEDSGEFWLGMAAKGLSLSLNLASNGASVSNATQSSQLVTDLVMNGLDFSITLLNSGFVNAVIPPAVQPVKNFMLNGSELFAQKMQQSSDSGFAFPVLLAQIASDFVFAEMQKTALSPVVPVAKTVSDWNLNFVGQDNNWALLLSAIDNPSAFDPTSLISSLVTTGGLGQLSCDLNLLLPSDIPNIPPAFVLTPFVAVNELLTLKDNNGNSIDINAVPQNERALYLVDVAAGLSNLWSNPMGCNGVSSDQRLAKLLRQFKKVDLSNGEIAAISTVGNLGLGALHALVPNEPVLDVFDIAWNGTNDSPGIDDALKLGMSAAHADAATNALSFLEFTAKVPKTMAASVDVLTQANSPTAKLLRIVTGNVMTNDLLAPDELFSGSDTSIAGQFKYGIPNGVLASIGLVRKSLTPNNSSYANRHNYYVDNNPYGFLKINPIAALESPNKLFILTADYARSSINALKPIFEGFEQTNRIDEINQRAMFSELTGTAVGFSGVSGGLQREWSKDWTNDNDFGDLEVQAYGNFSIPLVVDSAVLMTFQQNTQNSTLTFDSAGEGAVSGIGLASDFTGVMAVGSNGLGLSYDGELSVEFMLRPMWSAATSGYVSNFEFENSDDYTDFSDYAIQQAENINVGMCIEANSSVVPAPISIVLGTDFQVDLGIFAQKNGLELLAGSRVGMSMTMNVPGFVSPFALFPLGVNFGGDITQAYVGEFNPNESQASLEYQACASPDLSLNFFGDVIPLAGANVQMAAYTAGDGNSLTTGLKFKIGADSSTSNNTTNASEGLKSILKCGVGLSDPLKIATCAVISSAQLGTLWGVIEVTGSISNPQAPVLKMGLGKDFPNPGEEHLMFDASVLANTGEIAEEIGDFFTSVLNITEPIDLPDLTPIGVKQIGEWGGWPTVGVIPSLCQPKLCEGNVPAIGGN